MRYAGLIQDDFVNGIGVCTSIWVQGCPHRCKGCHNAQTWDYDGGIEIDETELIDKILASLTANGLVRNLSILGGEPLVVNNENFVMHLIQVVREKFPLIKIFLWTGYTYEELNTNLTTARQYILHNVDVLIDGRFELDKRDVSLPLRGSSNQHIFYKWREKE